MMRMVITEPREKMSERMTPEEGPVPDDDDEERYSKSGEGQVNLASLCLAELCLWDNRKVAMFTAFCALSLAQMCKIM